MVDLSKHLARAKQAIERRNYDMALELTIECHELDPSNIENIEIMVDAAKRRQREGGKKGLLPVMCFSKDPYKRLCAALKQVSKGPSIKALKAAGDAAMRVFETGVKAMVDVAIMLYNEGKSTGMHDPDLLWNLAHAYIERFNEHKDKPSLENAIAIMGEFETTSRGHKQFPEAGRKIRSWEAMRSMARREEVGKPGDYRSMISSTDGSAKAEAMNKIIRTEEDALQVLAYCDQDLEKNPDDKQMWIKRGDILRRINRLDEARESFEKAQQIDAHDFVVIMRLGDLRLHGLRQAYEEAKAAGGDASAQEQALVEAEIAEYRSRVERQPTEMGHRYNLATRLYQTGDIDGAASEFQQALKDPRFKRDAHKYLGHCFARKKLLDLSRDQFTSCLSLVEDHLSDEYKDVLYNRGRISEALGNMADAVNDYTKVVEIDLGFKDAAERLNACRSSS